MANDIEVRLPSSAERSDAGIAAAATRALEWDALVPMDRIKVTVSRGWVTLEGQVNWEFEKSDAERVVRCLAGVKGVSNLITVSPRIQPSPTDLKRKLEDALVRDAETDAQRIQVEVQGTKVSLRGKVCSWAKKRETEAIMDRGNSEYYSSAAHWLARVRDAYRVAVRAGKPSGRRIKSNCSPCIAANIGSCRCSRRCRPTRHILLHVLFRAVRGTSWEPCRSGPCRSTSMAQSLRLFLVMTRCLAGSGSARANFPPMCAGVHTRRCLLVFVSSVVPRIVSRHPLWLPSWKSTREKATPHLKSGLYKRP